MESKQDAIQHLSALKSKGQTIIPLVYHCSEISDISEFTMRIIRDNRISFPKYQSKKTMRESFHKAITLNYPNS